MKTRAANLGRCLLAAALMLSGRTALRAADATRDDELRKKTEEVERLKEELSRAQKELRELRQDNQRLRQAEPARAPGARPARPVPPMAQLPPLEPDATVDAEVLMGHFRADPAAAAARYGGKRIRVKGEIARFDLKLLRREYDVHLATGEPALSVACHFNYIDKYAAVFVKQGGSLLVARTGPHERQLHRVGQTLVIRGKCGGLKDGQLSLGGCEVAR